MKDDRRAFTFVEVLVALAILSVAGLFLMATMNGGAEAGARASEMRMATALGARVMDRLVADGYERLKRRIKKDGPSGDLKLALTVPPWARKKDDDTRLVVDGYEYSGTYRFEEKDEGLIRLTIDLSWQRYGLVVPEQPGQLELVRFVADPTLALASREPF
jgi:prepilin-type N-terminal cleavage/methylation domain-containing protein